MQIRPCAQRLPGGHVDQVGGQIFAGVLVDVMAQPAEQGSEASVGDVVRDGGQVGDGLVEKLGGGQVADGVGGEVTDQAASPMRILEHAQPVLGNVEAQV